MNAIAYRGTKQLDLLPRSQAVIWSHFSFSQLCEGNGIAHLCLFWVAVAELGYQLPENQNPVHVLHTDLELHQNNYSCSEPSMYSVLVN